MNPTFAIKTFGCQMNVYDSERMAEALVAAGHAPAREGEDAELVVINTCHIREHASEKLYHEVGRIRSAAHAEGRAKPLIAVTGCVAQAEGAEIARRSPAVDMVVGPQAYHRLPGLVARAGAGERGLIDTDMPAAPKFEALPARTRAAPVSAFLTVQEGCDKFCTYCVVPYTRGSEVSRPAGAIVAEARALVAAGALELTLLGQNVNAYVDADGTTLAGVIRAIAAIPGLARIRYTTSHPCDMADDLIFAHAEVPALMPYLHLPVQSGSDRVLRAMNRAHDAASYLALIARIRAARPDIALSGDFIVGFPGETEAEFADTLRIVDAADYAQAYAFKFSARPGTPAAELPDPVADPVKIERLARLHAAIAARTLAFNQSKVGHRMDVLLERPGRRHGQLIGKSPWLQSVHVDAGEHGIGDIVMVDIVDAQPNSLAGTLVRAPARAAA